MEHLANPSFSDHWGAHRAIVNWITTFTTTVRDNIIALAHEQLESSTSKREPTRPGSPYMEHTLDFDESELPEPPASALEANL